MRYSDIQPYIEKGLISEQLHPENDDIRIFNYTQQVQFSGEWDDVTRQCRGFILNVKTGEVLARPFPKFFNYQEHVVKGWPVPSEVPVITEKLDGSLGILYWLDGKPRIATRGSFISDQAVWATRWLGSEPGSKFLTNDGITHLFEIIYPENRIVVNYDFSGLVHIASIDTATGLQIPATVDSIMFRKPRIIPADSLKDLEGLDEPNSEGFVAYYPNANTRIKLKFPEYVRLHKIITGVSEIGVWEMLRDGQDLKPLIEKVPDEFFRWITDVKDRLKNQFINLYGEAELRYLDAVKLPTRKEQALYIASNAQIVSGVVFSLLDGQINRAEQQVWKMIRPRGKSVFKVDADA